MNDDLGWAQTFATLAGLLYPVGPDNIAKRVTAAAQDLVPGCEEAAICLLDRHGFAQPVAATGGPAAAADRGWHEAGNGPCLTAIRDHVVHRIPDLLCEDGSGAAGPEIARATGIRSVVALPLVAGTDVLGALTLATASPHAFTPAAVALGTVLATHAALALESAAARERNAELADALRSSRLIGMAMGIVMARRLLTPEQAFDVLRRGSRRQGRKVRDLAAEIVTTGEPPGR